ncbi:hypothetical protein [Kangiella sediminilitoris]|uniref:Lipoprotein n=1 Tax=Kangiella sediminilitoris TaxID=1144748 RepID=A0A1B3B9K4_9GAMM|nr:hypothetical protein [Kangiella sediminilitoris]AOE49479.1 hypothetical protein KS2013_755 [Kangiella sediminilitoris]
MKTVITLLLTFTIVGCGTSQVKEPEPLSKEWLDARYSLGIIFKEQPGVGLEVLLISKYSNSYHSGLKTGWVLENMDGVSLADNGSKALNQRLQDSSKSHEILFNANTGEENLGIYLTRQKFGSIKKEKGSWVMVE